MSLADQARAHTEQMHRKYAAEIQTSITGTVVFQDTGPESVFEQRKPNLRLQKADTVSALFSMNLKEAGKTALLNFASFLHPGGGFLNGAMAQEEALCHASTLYNVLSQIPDFYRQNAAVRNNGLYQNMALYSPGILFFLGNQMRSCDVITCAAPNWKQAESRQVAPSANNRALESRSIIFPFMIFTEFVRRCTKK